MSAMRQGQSSFTIGESADLNHLTAQQYTNWKFKSTGRREKAIGNFYDKFKTDSGCEAPSGMFHDAHVIHVPGQTPSALPSKRDASKYYGGFTTKDGYEVPAGLFHSPDIVSISGQAVELPVTAVAAASPAAIPAPRLKKSALVLQQRSSTGCYADDFKPATPQTAAGSELVSPTSERKSPNPASERESPKRYSPSFPHMPRTQSPLCRSMVTPQGMTRSLPRASVIGCTSPPRRPPVVVGQPVAMESVPLQSPRIAIMPLKSAPKRRAS